MKYENSSLCLFLDLLLTHNPSPTHATPLDERQCMPLTQRPKSRLTCAHAGPLSQKCVMTCGQRGHLTSFPQIGHSASRGPDGGSLAVGLLQPKKDQVTGSSTSGGDAGVISTSPGLAAFWCGPETGYNWTGLDDWGGLPHCSGRSESPLIDHMIVWRRTKRNWRYQDFQKEI